MMSLCLLDDSLSVDVFYEKSDNEFQDNICLYFWESCPEDEKVFLAEETNLFLTPAQARELARMLLEAANASAQNHSSAA